MESKIKDILDKFVHKPPYYIENDLSVYILHMIRTIENLHVKTVFSEETKIREYFPSLIESVFLMENVNKKYCSGNIIYLNHKDKNYMFIKEWGKIILDEQGDSVESKHEKLDRFVEYFLDTIKDCDFTSILLDIQDPVESHANLLLVCKDSEGLILSLYDPHGYKGDNISDLFVDLFASSLAQKYEGSIVVQNRVNVSCPIGLQEFSNDKKGYCSIFSLLWVYVIINLQESITEEERRLLFENLVIVEKSIIELYSQKELYNIVLLFASNIMIYYTKNILTDRMKKDFYSEYDKQSKGDNSWGFKIDL